MWGPIPGRSHAVWQSPGVKLPKEMARPRGLKRKEITHVILVLTPGAFGGGQENPLSFRI